MNSTSTLLGSDFAEKAFGAIEEGLKQGAQLAWSILIAVLKAHPLLITSAILLLLAIALFKAMAGRWGALGSLLYNLIYGGILFLIGLIWGPEIFVNDLFSATCTILLYPFCYFLVGIILDRLGVRRRFRI